MYWLGKKVRMSKMRCIGWVRRLGGVKSNE